MMMDTHEIDWPALAHTTGDVPWDVIHAAVAAVVARPTLLDEIIARFSAITAEPYVIPTFEYYYLPYIMAKAARNLPSADAEKVHDWLISELITAADLDDDALLEFFLYCSQSQGTAILPSLLKAMNDPYFDSTSCAWFHLWGVTDVLKESNDEHLRAPFAALAMRTLQQAVEKIISCGDAVCAAHTAATLKVAAAEPLLEKLAHLSATSSGTDEFVENDFWQSLSILQGHEPDYPMRREDLLQHVNSEKESLEKWYANRPNDWNIYNPEDDLEHDALDDADWDEDDEDLNLLHLGLPPLPPGIQSFEPSEPIRNKTRKVGRNNPCPCGSGKKYKKCCAE